MRRTVIIARHGLTDFNNELRWQGLINKPPNKIGEKQSLITAERIKEMVVDEKLSIKRVYTSYLIRASRFAVNIAKLLKLDIVVENGLAEYDLGEWDGKTFEEVARLRPYYHKQFKLDRSLLPPAPGEKTKSIAQEFEDSKKTAGKIINLEKENDILIVGHGGRLIQMIIAITGWKLNNINNLYLDNCSITKILLPPEKPCFDPGDWTTTHPVLKLFNSTEHLKNLKN